MSNFSRVFQLFRSRAFDGARTAQSPIPKGATRMAMSEVQFEVGASRWGRWPTASFLRSNRNNYVSDREASGSPIAGTEPARARNVRFFLI
jgi:hypothetical protein